jgi:hypothetical protein
MWADGIFSESVDAALFGGALVLSCLALWRFAPFVGLPRFRYARVALWSTIALVLLPAAGVSGMVGLWGGVLIASLGGGAAFQVLGPALGGLGILLAPPAVILGLSLFLASVFCTTRPTATTA